MNNRITQTCFAILILIGLMAPAQAQLNHIHSQNLGMGGSGTAFTTDYHAIFINPANQMFNDRGTRFSFGMAGFGMGVGGPIVNIGVYNDYFTTGRTIDAATSVELTDAWFGNGSNAKGSLGMNLDLVPLGFSFRTPTQAFGFAVRTRFMNTFEMNKGMLQLGLTGFSSEVFSDFMQVNTSMDVLNSMEFAFSYARKVWESDFFYYPGKHTLYAGITPVFAMSYGYASFSMDSDLRIRANEQDLTHNYSISFETVGDLSKSIQQFLDDKDSAEDPTEINLNDYLDSGFDDLGSVQGSGMKFNAGLTYEWDRGEIAPDRFFGQGRNIIRVSLTAHDIGAIAYNNNPMTFTSSGTFQWDGIDLDQDRIDRDFDGDRNEYINYVLTDSLVNEVYFNFSERNDGTIRQTTTPSLTLGMAYNYGRASAVFDFSKGFNNRGIHSERVMSSIGGQYLIIGAIPVRFGMRLGGFTSPLYSFGTGLSLRNFEFSVGAMTRSSSGSRGNAIMFAWSGLHVRF